MRFPGLLAQLIPQPGTRGVIDLVFFPSGHLSADRKERFLEDESEHTRDERIGFEVLFWKNWKESAGANEGEKRYLVAPLQGREARVSEPLGLASVIGTASFKLAKRRGWSRRLTLWGIW